MTLIENTLGLIASSLDQYLCQQGPAQQSWVALTNPVNSDGSPNPLAANRVVMALTNVHRETVFGTTQPTHSNPGDGYVTAAPPLCLNLQVLFMANFEGANYRDGLSMLSHTIGFFQQTPVFTAANLPGLDPAITRLELELEDLDLAGFEHLMALLGTRYLPAAVYTLRTLPITSDSIPADVPPVQGLR